jgi:flagellar biosynthesis protein FlhB
MAEDQDPETKTEEPTDKRLRDSRKKGEVARSQEVNHFMILLGAGLFLVALVPHTMQQLYDVMRAFLEQPHLMHLDLNSIGTVLTAVLFDMLKALALPFLLFVIMAFASGPIQYGLLFTTEPITPKWSKISPLKGIKRIFSLQQLVELLKGIMKITVVGAVAGIIIAPVLGSFSVFTGIDMGQLLAAAYAFALKVIGGVLMVMAVVAMMDTLYQRYEYYKKLRMTKQEVKDEMKQAEGDPLIKQRLRRLRMERARRRMMQNVPKADVVITNPTHFAVALKYDTDAMEAPQVVAKGQDLVALKIRDLAHEHEVPVVENPPLARTLFAAYDIDDMIQPEHYQAVAEIISYVFKLKRRVVSSAAG